MTPTAAPAPGAVSLRERITEGLSALLRQGASPEGLALSLAVGACLGLFPILGATTFLCLLVGAVFRLNHAALQLANYAMAALQLVLILAFVRLGEWLTGAPAMPLNPLELGSLFRANPSAFLARFGLTGLRGILGWSLVAPFLGLLLFAMLLPLVRGLARGLRRL